MGTNRCKNELVSTASWKTLEVNDVPHNHINKAKGMLYGLEFPWTEEGLVSMGPEWLTKAFHAAGTLAADNKVTKLTMEKKIRVTTGNNGGRFFFEVRYAKTEAYLHHQLFAKIPWPCQGKTKADRLASPMNKQAQQ